MIRLLHFADLHLGVGSYGRLDPNTGLSSRIGDFLSSLDYVVDYALDNDVHLVLFAGDAYKTCNPSPTLQREFASRIGRLVDAHIPTVLLPGNHDVPRARSRAHSMAIFDTFGIKGMYVPSRLTTLRLETKNGKVQVVALPHVGRSEIAALDEHKNKSIEEIQEAIIERVDGAISGEIAGLGPDIPTILLAHTAIYGATFSSEQRTKLGHDLLLPANLCTHPTFDYVALGHIHKHQVLSEAPPVVYSGSLERIDFGEEKEEKGFIVAEVERGRAEFEFVPTPARKFVTIRVRATGDTPMFDIDQAVKDCDVEGAVVRMIIQVTEEAEPFIDDNACRQMLKDAFHITAITHKVERSERMRLGQEASMESLSPRELLGTYFERRGADPDRMATLLERADELMAEAEVDHG